MKKQRGEVTSGGGIGIFGLLGVIFITLKVLEIGPVATWSWWWVTAPLWGGFVLAVFILIVCAVFVARLKS